MSHREIQQPTVVRVDSHGTTYAHPAYGAIRASRISGSTVLFGSDFIHHNYVMVEIAPATLRRDLAHDWIHGGVAEIVRVAMSEAQWATFVSSLNMGSGTPCTIERRENQTIPDLPDPASRTQQFEQESLGMVQQIIDRVVALSKHVADVKLPEKQRAAILHELEIIRSHLVANIPYVGQAFTEHTERVTEHAKVEIDAYLQQVLMRAGINAIGSGQTAAQPPIELPAFSDSKK